MEIPDTTRDFTVKIPRWLLNFSSMLTHINSPLSKYGPINVSWPRATVACMLIRMNNSNCELAMRNYAKSLWPQLLPHFGENLPLLPLSFGTTTLRPWPLVLHLKFSLRRWLTSKANEWISWNFHNRKKLHNILWINNAFGAVQAI